MEKRSSSQSAWALLASSVAQARVESHRIRHMVNRGQKLVEKSAKKDHLYEVGGDVIVGLPQRLAHLERLLDRTSYALSIMGEDFFKGRLSLDDKEMVEQAVKYSQSPFPSSAQRVATRYLQRKASAQDVIARADKALQQGKINQAEHNEIVTEHTNKQKPNMSGRLAGILYGRATFRFNHTNTNTPTRQMQGGKAVKVKVPSQSFIGDVTLEAHAYYRLDLRDISTNDFNSALNSWSMKMHKGYLDIQSGIRTRQNSANAEFYRSYKRNNGRGSDNYYHQGTDTTIVISASPRGTTNRFDLFIVTMYKGQGSGGYRSRFAYRPPASELPGSSTWVNEDSKKNLTPNTSKSVGDNAESRERSGPQVTENKQQALPIRNDHSDKRDQKMPISQTDGQGTARPQFNAPPESDSATGGRPIHKEKVRTRSMPGDDYGVPYKDDGYSLTRRTMKADFDRFFDDYFSDRD